MTPCITIKYTMTPEQRARVRAGHVPDAPRGFGDVVEKTVHTIARAIHWPCLDREKNELKPQSPCAKMRDKLNAAFPAKTLAKTDEIKEQ